MTDYVLILNNGKMLCYMESELPTSRVSNKITDCTEEHDMVFICLLEKTKLN